MIRNPHTCKFWSAKKSSQPTFLFYMKTVGLTITTFWNGHLLEKKSAKFWYEDFICVFWMVDINNVSKKYWNKKALL